MSDSAAVHLRLRLVCATEDDAALVRRLLPEHIRLSRAEPGCLLFETHQRDDPLVWHVEERFRDRAAFAAHQRRTRGSEWGRRTAHIPREHIGLAPE